jgi:hypothetical protein
MKLVTFSYVIYFKRTDFHETGIDMGTIPHFSYLTIDTTNMAIVRISEVRATHTA